MFASTNARTEPVLHDPLGDRLGYRDWTVAHGRAWNYFDADPNGGTCTVQVMDGWSLRITPVRGHAGARVHVTKAQKWWQHRIKHALHRRSFRSVADAHEALFNAGVLAVRVYEDQTVQVKAFTRVGLGYGDHDRVQVLSGRVPPTADQRTLLDEAYAITRPSTAYPHQISLSGTTAVAAQAAHYQHQGYPELSAGDLVDIDGQTYEMTAEQGWRQVTLTDRYQARQPLTVATDEVAAVDGWDLLDLHYVDTAALVNLTVGEYGWKVDSTSVDGHSLDVAAEDKPYDNTECAERMEDGEECDPDSHRAVELDVYSTLDLPTGAELVPLLGAAVLNATHARRDGANADLLRLYGKALHTVDRELGDLVLRAVFGRQLAEQQSAAPMTINADGSRIVRLSRDLHAVIAALIAPSTEVNHEGVIFSDEAGAERTALFPIEDFWAWANEPGAADDEDNPRYLADAGM